MTTFLSGWKALIRLICDVLHRLADGFEEFWIEFLVLLGSRERRVESDACCIAPPTNIRARPDPFIYSQQWLEARHIAYTWDNPDFTLIDPATGAPVNNHQLHPATTYELRITVHNNSVMAALGTEVHVQVLHFGAGTPPSEDLGTMTVYIPAAGSAVASTLWTTPAAAGHHCLQAILSHPDDANPLNNVGQHNTDVAAPASPTRKLEFRIDRPEKTRRQLRITLDTYQLPSAEESQCAGSYEERQTLRYLRLLQERHDRGRFPVPETIRPRLHVAGTVLTPVPRHATPTASRGAMTDAPKASLTELRFDHPGGELLVTAEFDPSPPGFGDQPVNVNVYEGEQLVGGITAYVQEA